MTGATGRNSDFHGERIPTRTHAPVTRNAIVGTTWALFAVVAAVVIGAIVWLGAGGLFHLTSIGVQQP